MKVGEGEEYDDYSIQLVGVEAIWYSFQIQTSRVKPKQLEKCANFIR